MSAAHLFGWWLFAMIATMPAREFDGRKSDAKSWELKADVRGALTPREAIINLWLKNTSGDSQRLPTCSTMLEYEFLVFDPTGERLPLTSAAKAALDRPREHFSNTIVLPGQHLFASVNLAKYFNLTEAGEYTVFARRCIDAGDVSLGPEHRPTGPTIDAVGVKFTISK